MDTFQSLTVNAAHKILINFFRHKWYHGSSRLRYRHKCGIQCHISIDFVLLHSFRPETLTAPSHIPVAHIIHKILKRPCTLRNPVIFQVLIYQLYQCVQTGQKPLIHNIQFIVLQTIFCSIKVIDICIQHKECIGVP